MTRRRLPARRNANRPKYSRFMQQEWPAYRPIYNPKWIISAWILFGLFLIAFGVATLYMSRNIVEIVDRYDDECIPEGFRNDKVGFIQSSNDKTCNRTLIVPKNMKQPVYVYYQLENFHQNHRRYVGSRSKKDMQLRSNEANNKYFYECSPEGGTDNNPIVPCGLIAWSLFNDTYILSSNNKPLTINKRYISWKSDRERRFGRNVYPKNFQSGSFKGGATLDPSKPLSEQEDLMVWMRTAALPTFRKLYGKIEVDLLEGETIHVSIENNYNTYSFNGKKKLILSTAGWFGGKNDYLGIAFLIVGGLYLAIGIVFLILYLIRRREPGDPSYLSWNRHLKDH